ncbi:flavodoxin domain-containing protein [Streptacidiphilus rugosus]|uniref:flavodoxin domain-containing protein n=1 Tax=Streptacidiphilus rugosus TaxID=405783 RepID=UPI000564BA7E|nr:flavodoxin domain-containing protein [Streptacidiphilus rugosus]
MTVLVGYASAHGSTREIAQRLGTRLAELGCPADVVSLDGDVDPRAHGAVVLGSAVHGQHWLPVAEDFVRAHRDVLAERPLWAFSVGLPAALRGPWRRLAGKEERVVLDALALPASLRGHRLLSGVIAPEHVGRAGALMFRLVGGRFGDHRDWQAVDALAADIATALRPGM